MRRFLPGVATGRLARIWLQFAAVFIFSLLATVSQPRAQEVAADADLQGLIQELAAAEGRYRDIVGIVERIAGTGDPGGVPLLRTLEAGNLYFRDADIVVFGAEEGGEGFIMHDPVTDEVLGEVATGAATKIGINNSVRRAIRSALGNLTLLSPDRSVRLAAAEAVLAARDQAALSLLIAAIEVETDAAVRTAMEEAHAAIIVGDNNTEDDERLAAIEILGERGDQAAVNVLAGIARQEGLIAEAAADAVAVIEQSLAFWGIGQNIWYGISLGSVLLLAAFGLAITFGVMGVINMAHGEMVMLGAYTTFVIQELIRVNAPQLFDWSLAFAIPLAFLVSGGVGILIERGVIRWLYGRPLETLLATWGISLILQQAVRTIFGPTNKLVGNPSWMSGSFELGHITVTYSRMWIVAFALAVFAALMVFLRRTRFGLQIRAVTQNRQMASAMGIRTPWVDALTFGLGSGIAGMAGVALSQIDNVSPNLGQAYIIDSFMVVVFGGVGNLWGTFVGAMSLGVANKFIEPYAGAVLAKILVLAFIILFIQRRPRGLFALRGRSVEQ